MTKPTILTVDDDPMVSAAITRDLRARYGADYRIVRAGSGARRSRVLVELALRDHPVALIASDQRMPEMTGIELLEQSRAYAPGAKLLLLTAYADTDVAIRAINDIGLDYYLLKPWDPPEERLYPVIDDLLGDWREGAPGPHLGRARDRAPLVRPQPRAQDRSSRATTCPTAGTTSSGTPRRGGSATSPGRRPTTSRWCWSPTATPLRSPSTLELAARARPAHAARSSRCTTCASSAAGRPAWRPPCTPRPRG